MNSLFVYAGVTVSKDDHFSLVLLEVTQIIKQNLNDTDKLKAICKLLKDKVTYYNWVGFYAVNSQKQTELVLTSFEGEPTDHIRIPFSKGICGQAAELKKTFVIQDVSRETNYLSCNSKVKSEIVIPVFRGNILMGELDIDSHCESPFSVEDESFLTKIADMVGELLKYPN